MRSNLKRQVTKNFLAVLIMLGLLVGCSSPSDMAHRFVFMGTTKSIGALLEEHPQVIGVSWMEMPVMGEGVILARVTFKAPVGTLYAFTAAEAATANAVETEKERMGSVAIRCVGNSAQILSVTSTPRTNYLVEELGNEVACANVTFFLRALERKENLAYGFWGVQCPWELRKNWSEAQREERREEKRRRDEEWQKEREEQRRISDKRTADYNERRRYL